MILAQMMNDDLRILNLLGFGSAIDGVAAFSFFAVAATYFFAPVIGYGPQRRGQISAALYVLLAYAGMAVLQFGVMFLGLLDRGGGRPDEVVGLAVFAFAILKLLCYFVSMLLYVMGLHSLRLARPEPPREDWDERRFADR